MKVAFIVFPEKSREKKKGYANGDHRDLHSSGTSRKLLFREEDVDDT
jgi:hypothetical protein